jgi:ABC-type hemin transport system ATPase subunit
VLLEKGRVAFDGPTNQAMAGDQLSKVFGCTLESKRSAMGYWQVTLKAMRV